MTKLTASDHLLPSPLGPLGEGFALTPGLAQRERGDNYLLGL